MASVEEARANGYVTDLVMHDGIVLHKRVSQNVRNMKELEIRDGDVIICTFPKSGTHWVWEIVSMLMKGRAEYAEQWQNVAHLGGRTPDQLNHLPSPRVFFSHLFPRMLSEGFWERKCHVINVQRNPKDAIVSRYNQDVSQNWTQGQSSAAFTGTWHQYFDLHMTGSDPNGCVFDHLAAWNSFPRTHPDVPFLQIHYEDLKKEPVAVVRRIAEFLKRPLAEKTYTAIVELCKFENLKEASENKKDQTFHIRWKKGTSGYFRKGVTGDWKNWFTVAQSERFDLLYKKSLHQEFPY